MGKKSATNYLKAHAVLLLVLFAAVYFSCTSQETDNYALFSKKDAIRTAKSQDHREFFQVHLHGFHLNLKQQANYPFRIFAVQTYIPGFISQAQGGNAYDHTSHLFTRKLLLLLFPFHSLW